MISTIKTELGKARIIASLESDDKKIELMLEINDEYGKAEIIASLRDEEVRFGLMKKLKPEARMTVIATLSDDIIKEKEFNEVIEKESIENWEEKNRYSSYIASVIKSFKKSEKRKELLTIIDKLEFLYNENFGREYDKAEIIATFEKDDDKIEFIEKLKEPMAKAIIISSLKDDDEKIKYLSSIESNEIKAIIVKSLSDDDKKIELMKSFSNQHDRADVISSLQDDNKKIKLLKTIREKQAKAVIIASLTEDALKIKFLQENFIDTNNSVDCFYRYLIIITLNSDKLKLELLDTVKDDMLRAQIIATLGSYYKKESEKEIIDVIGKKKDKLDSLVREEKNLNNQRQKSSVFEKK